MEYSGIKWHIYILSSAPKAQGHHRRGGEKMLMLEQEIGKDQRKTVSFRYNRTTAVINS